MSEALAQQLPVAPALRYELGVEDVIAQVQKIQRVMEAVMKEGEHYGKIPGTNKPTLLKPGAEKLCLTFRLDPQYESTEHYDGKHLTVKSRCTLYHIASGQRMGSGEGSCSTKESKYAYRQGKRLCPTCGKDTIIKGKEEYGGGWLCFAKRGGCGGKWKDGDAAIEAQSTERVPNDDLADQYNTILKMANKRALVASVLNVTAASDIFTQDLEDMPEPTAPRPAPTIIDAEVVHDASPKADLFTAPVTDDRAKLVSRGTMLMNALKMKQDDRQQGFKTYLGTTTPDQATVDVSALSDWVTWLEGRAKNAGLTI